MDSNLEDLFNASASYVQYQSTSEDGKKLNQSQLLELYGLYKSAVIGPCNEQKPGIFNQKALAKWKSWKSKSDFKKEEAQQSYIDRVKEYFNWIPDERVISKSGDMKSSMDGMSSFLGGNCVSTFAKIPENEEEDPSNSPVFGWAKDNDITQITEWLEEGNDVNIKDNEGLSILHWVVDRGHVEACELLLQHGADPFISDTDGQSPLDYAITCEHTQIVQILNSYKK